MSKLVSLLAVLGVLTGVTVNRAHPIGVLSSFQSLRNDPITTPEAGQIWEEAISAKGGRQRLHGIRNMLQVSSAEYKTQIFSIPASYLSANKNRKHMKIASLYVFPNKFWDYEDYGSDVFGKIMHMYNYETGMKYILTLGDPDHPLERIEPKETRDSRTYGLVASLLETNWIKPAPLRASPGKIAGKTVNIVETTVNGQRIDFAFDSTTHLATRVSFYSESKGQTYVTTETLSDYIDVDGIMLPQVAIMDDGTIYKARTQLNVDFDPEIFVRPPRFEQGPIAWRPKAR